MRISCWQFIGKAALCLRQDRKFQTLPRNCIASNVSHLRRWSLSLFLNTTEVQYVSWSCDEVSVGLTKLPATPTSEFWGQLIISTFLTHILLCRRPCHSWSADTVLLGYCYGLKNLFETSVLGDGNVNSYPKVIKKKNGSKCSQI